MKAHIYRILKGSPQSGIIVPALRTELSVRLGRGVGDQELRDSLNDMAEARHLHTDSDEMTGDPRVSLTPAGRKAARRV